MSSSLRESSSIAPATPMSVRSNAELIRFHSPPVLVNLDTGSPPVIDFNLVCRLIGAFEFDPAIRDARNRLPELAHVRLQFRLRYQGFGVENPHRRRLPTCALDEEP